MEAGIVNQFGDKSIYVGRNEGEIYEGSGDGSLIRS